MARRGGTKKTDAAEIPEGFEWYAAKNRRNVRDHDGVGFMEAHTVSSDPFAITVPDEGHSEDEDREWTLGMSTRNRVLVVSHTQRGENIRIISARKANASRIKQYNQG